MESLLVMDVVTGDFCVKLHLRSKHDGFEWIFVPVYGAAQEIHKAEFLSELVRMCEAEPLPMFSIFFVREKRNTMIIFSRIGPLFNAIIESLDLREIVLSDRQFTWVTKRDNPTYEKLDRVLASVKMGEKISSCFCKGVDTILF